MARELSASMETILRLLDDLQDLKDSAVENQLPLGANVASWNADTLTLISEVGEKYAAQKPQYPISLRTQSPDFMVQ